MTIKTVALLAAVLSFSSLALADKPPVNTPDPNAVTSYQQTVYQGQGAETLLILLQTVGMDPQLTVHKMADGTQVGPFISTGVALGWAYQSNAPTSSGNSYPVPPANFFSAAPGTPTAGVQAQPRMETLSFSMVVTNKTVCVGVFQYAFNTQTKHWEWKQLSYTDTQLPTPPASPKK